MGANGLTFPAECYKAGLTQVTVSAAVARWQSCNPISNMDIPGITAGFCYLSHIFMPHD